MLGIFWARQRERWPADPFIASNCSFTLREVINVKHFASIKPDPVVYNISRSKWVIFKGLGGAVCNGLGMKSFLSPLKIYILLNTKIKHNKMGGRGCFDAKKKDTNVVLSLFFNHVP